MGPGSQAAPNERMPANWNLSSERTLSWPFLPGQPVAGYSPPPKAASTFALVAVARSSAVSARRARQG